MVGEIVGKICIAIVHLGVLPNLQYINKKTNSVTDALILGPALISKVFFTREILENN